MHPVSMSGRLQSSLLFVAVLVMMVPTSESQAMDARRRRTSSASSFDDNARRRRTDSFSDSRRRTSYFDSYFDSRRRINSWDNFDSRRRDTTYISSGSSGSVFESLGGLIVVGIIFLGIAAAVGGDGGRGNPRNRCRHGVYTHD